VGYLLYPINFFVWAYLLGAPTDAPDVMPDVVPAAGADAVNVR
jgi:hypothetical protein